MASSLTSKVALARALGAISRRAGGGGTSAPGKLLLRLAPGAIGSLGARLGEGSVLVTATNGKTTAATMAAAILRRAGHSLVYNSAGANMAGGIATTLLEASRGHSGMAGELGLFEVDEMWLSSLAAELRPRAIVVGNLFRDQLDRYGELEAIAEAWQQTLIGSDARLVLNADDPLVADLGRPRRESLEPKPLYFGVEDPALALAGLAHAADAKHCRRCGAPYVFDAVFLGHLGHYHCDACGQSRPEPEVSAADVRLHGVRSSSFTLVRGGERHPVELALPGLYNVYNALAAAALATALGVTLATVAAGLQDTRAAFGRAETLMLTPHGDMGGDRGGPARETRILLIKNPAGANEVLRTLALEPGEHDVLGILNDRIADGRDVSWIWDADFELLADRIAGATCSGTRAADLAARLKYAGVDAARIRVEPDIAQALDRALRDVSESGGADPTLYALPTYTAMLALRELLVSRGEAPSSWA
jgi:lipid II isoglutaminyl synthase (glutamine-hydrolysing)